jgi:hypothetical protein
VTAQHGGGDGDSGGGPLGPEAPAGGAVPADAGPARPHAGKPIVARPAGGGAADPASQGLLAVPASSAGAGAVPVLVPKPEPAPVPGLLRPSTIRAEAAPAGDAAGSDSTLLPADWSSRLVFGRRLLWWRRRRA